MRKFVATITPHLATPDETDTHTGNAAMVRALFSPAGCEDGNVEMTLCEFAVLDAYLATIADGSTTLRLDIDYFGVRVTVTPAP